MDLKPWPVDFAQKKAGIGCPQCDQGRVDETEHGVRFFVGEIADGYLQKSGPTAGYSVVIFRGRHVGAPHEMTGDEHAAFWSEVGFVAAAIERVYRPVHLNFQILGNQDPHVHVHIVPRHNPDPAPSMPLPAEAWIASRRLDDISLAANHATFGPCSDAAGRASYGGHVPVYEGSSVERSRPTRPSSRRVSTLA